MFVRGRRPLARASMVGGAAYYAGKKWQEARTREEDQEYRPQQLEEQQAKAAPPPAAVRPASSGEISSDTIAKLEQLAQLRQSGVLTEPEFAVHKARLLGA